MKIAIKLMNVQYTTEVNDVSIDYANGDVVISEVTELKTDRSEEPVHVEQPEPSCKPSIKVEHDSKRPQHNPRLGSVMTYELAAEAIKLLKLGYSSASIARHFGILHDNISKINRGVHHYCEDFPDVTFPIQNNAVGRNQYSAWRTFPVTYCKECGEPIPVTELQCDSDQCYCKKCAEKLTSDGTLKNDEHTAEVDDHADIIESIKRVWINPKTAAKAIKLLEFGYSVSSISRELGVAQHVVSGINNGKHSYCKGFPSKKFPIQYNTRGGIGGAWRKIPVTYCKECGEPIPLADLLKNPRCGYCPDCKAKHKEE